MTAFIRTRNGWQRLIKTFQSSPTKLQDTFAAKAGRPLTVGLKEKTLLTRQNGLQFEGLLPKQVIWEVSV